MKVQTRAIHFKADQKLLDYIEEKLAKLERFFSRIIEADVFLQLESNGRVKDKITEIRLKVPGNTLVAKGTSKTFEEAIDRAIDVMKRNLKRYKEKLQSR